MIEAVIFDMDGLLIDSEPFWRKAEIEVFKSVGIDLDDDMCRETMGLRLDEIVSYWYGKHPWDIKKISLDQVENSIIHLMQEHIKSEGVLMPGVEEILSFLKRLDVPLGLASSSPYSLIKAVLERFDLEDCFDVYKSAQDEDFGKPHPAVYISAAQHMNVSPVNCLAIEDSFNGLLAAKAARMKTLVVPDAHEFDSSVYSIADLKLKTLLDFNENYWHSLNT